MNIIRRCKKIIKAIKILERYGIEAKEFYVDADDGKAREFLARSTSDKKVGF